VVLVYDVSVAGWSVVAEVALAFVVARGFPARVVLVHDVSVAGWSVVAEVALAS
jgi:hypothetical protein